MLCILTYINFFSSEYVDNFSETMKIPKETLFCKFGSNMTEWTSNINSSISIPDPTIVNYPLILVSCYYYVCVKFNMF